jgi:hypothetical protein
MICEYLVLSLSFAIANINVSENPVSEYVINTNITLLTND